MRLLSYALVALAAAVAASLATSAADVDVEARATAQRRAADVEFEARSGGSSSSSSSSWRAYHLHLQHHHHHHHHHRRGDAADPSSSSSSSSPLDRRADSGDGKTDASAAAKPWLPGVSRVMYMGRHGTGDRMAEQRRKKHGHGPKKAAGVGGAGVAKERVSKGSAQLAAAHHQRHRAAEKKPTKKPKVTQPKKQQPQQPQQPQQKQQKQQPNAAKADGKGKPPAMHRNAVAASMAFSRLGDKPSADSASSPPPSPAPSSPSTAQAKLTVARDVSTGQSADKAGGNNNGGGGDGGDQQDGDPAVVGNAGTLVLPTKPNKVPLWPGSPFLVDGARHAQRGAPSSSSKPGSSSPLLRLLPPKADGVRNSLGKGQDPAPVSRNVGSMQMYYFPDSDFDTKVFLRAAPSLNQAARSERRTIFTFPTKVVTMAPEIAAWTDDRYLVTVSLVKPGTIHSLLSQTSDPLGAYTDMGEIKDRDGNAVKGYDSHVFQHPNGKWYLAYSDYHAIILGELGGPNRITSDLKPIMYFPIPESSPLDLLNFFNTEAPSTVVLPRKDGGQTLNLVFATGNYQRNDYASRIMYVDAQADPLNPQNWALVQQPLLQSTPKVIGPGSGGFFDVGGGGDASSSSSSSSSQKWFTYSAWDTPWNTDVFRSQTTRTIRAQQVSWDDAGVLLPMAPVEAPQKE